ncbi:unnamed protein product [Debaryomyces tyrocola]|nr:unnamed protein product [Debaryomyces tyrocola]
MVHWIISDLPLGLIGICTCAYAASIFFFDPDSEGKMLISVLAFLISTVALINISIYHYIQKIRIYNEKLEKIVIPEFIENRPFKETNVMQKDEILAIILRNVNAKFVSSMKTKYIFRNIEQLVKFHDNTIAGFTKRYFEKYKDLPLEDIQGWDRMLLVAKNIQDEDLKDVYADMVSPEIIQKYSNMRPTTQENGLTTNGN